MLKNTHYQTLDYDSTKWSKLPTMNVEHTRIAGPVGSHTLKTVWFLATSEQSHGLKCYAAVSYTHLRAHET